MKSIKVMLAGLLAVPALVIGISFLNPVFVSAKPVTCSDGSTQAKQSDCPNPLQSGAGSAKGDSVNACLFKSRTCDSGIFSDIVNVALFLIGAISVIMIIYGGIRYTISGGEAKNVTAAKDTILYAVVGLVVAILAYAVVNFVIAKLT
jgi:hypothetical protein